MDSGNAALYVSHATWSPNPQLSTFAFLLPSSISTLIDMLPTKSTSALYVSHATSFPSPKLSTFAFLLPSSISTLINMLPNKMTTCPYAALLDYPLPQNTTLCVLR